MPQNIAPALFVLQLFPSAIGVTFRVPEQIEPAGTGRPDEDARKNNELEWPP